MDRIKSLYPAVNEEITPLPRNWSSKEKFNTIGLSQNNLRVHYKGHGKNHKDAASVQANHPIPSVCGLYYFEVKIVSKGRDGYMGIGLSAAGVSMNRLPGWDKLSYGYHGDDGHSFCSSGTGQPYGPTFTTGDIIGCGVNLIDNTCFYTKNGHNLGIAFTDLPPNLYPTVGLQTPGEIVDANFGQDPFVYNIENDILNLQSRTRQSIQDFVLSDEFVLYDHVIPRMVSGYLLHHGYCSTVEAFSSSIGQHLNTDLTAIRNRQKILKLISTGRMGEAIEMTSRYYPGLLEKNENLLFLLKCRQFIEMVNGTDSEINSTKSFRKRINSHSSTKRNVSLISSPVANSPKQTSVIQSNKISNKHYSNSIKNHNVAIDPLTNQTANNFFNGSITNNNNNNNNKFYKNELHLTDNNYDMDISDDLQNGNTNPNTDLITNANGNVTKNCFRNGNFLNESDLEDDFTEIDENLEKKWKVERILEFGRELYSMNQRLKNQHGQNKINEKVLEDAFSLLAYSDPRTSPVGWQLDPKQRQIVCDHLNSAILETSNLPRRPPLEIAVGHAQELMKLMANSNVSYTAFANMSNLLFQ